MIDLRININSRKRIIFLGILIALLIYSFCSSVAVQKPFNLDEGDFASLAHYIKLTGKPILYVSEDFVKDLCNLDLFSAEKHLGYGLWHPPLYGNLLALWFRILGETTVTGRLFGLFCALISLFLCLGITKQICFYEKINKQKCFFILSLVSILYLINPLIQQFSLLLDVDNSILTVLTLLYFYIFTKNHKKDVVRFDIYLGLVLGASLLAKLSTPPLLLIALFVFYLLQGEIGKAFKKTFIVGFVGLAFFLLIWFPYAKLLHLPLNFFSVYNYGTKVLPAIQYKIFFSPPLIKNSLVYYAAWVSPAFIILALISIGAQIRQFIRTKELPLLSVLIIFSFFVFFYYSFFYPRGAMMKYQFMTVPILIISISFLIFKFLKDITSKELIIYSVAGLVLLLFDSYFIPDSVLLAPYLLNNAIDKSVVLFYFLSLLLLPLALSFLLSRTLKVKYLILGFLVALFASNISLDAKQIAPYTTINDWRNYGEEGLKEAIDYLDQRVGPEDTIICRKDIGYYLREMKNRPMLKWHSNDNCFNLDSRIVNDYFLKIIKRNDIRYIELDRQAVRVSYLPQALSDRYSLERQFGDFTIFKKNAE